MTGWRISGICPARVEHLVGLGEAELAAHSAVRVVADATPGFPCRITLEDAEPGETLILANFEHQDAASPFRASHAIYFREQATVAASFDNQVPPVVATRLLSVRAFDEAGMMVGAEIIAGEAVAPLIDRMFADPRATYLHLHSARPGCFVARVDRIGSKRERSQ